MEMEIDVEAMVYEKYPVLEEEANCMTSRNLRNRARDAYRLKLLKQVNESKEKETAQPDARPQG